MYSILYRPIAAFLLLAAASLLAFSQARAQPSDTVRPGVRSLDSVNQDEVGLDSLVAGGRRLSIGVQGRVSLPPTNTRLILGVRAGALSIAPLTFAALDRRDELGTVVSINPLVTAAGILGFLIHPVVGAVFLLPQLLPNLSLELPLVRDRLGAVAAQRTDYFLNDNVFRIHTEAQFGLRFHIADFTVEALYVLPLTSSVTGRQGYLGAGISVDVIK